MFNIGTILIFIIGILIFIIINKKTKKKSPLVIYIITFIFIYIISSAIINDCLINNYLDSIDKNLLVFIELDKESLDMFELDGKQYYCKAVDYLEGRYRAMYYVKDGEEIYQKLGEGLLIKEIEDTENAYKVKITLRYNNLLKKFFMQFRTKTFNVIYVNKENINYLN